MEHMLVPQISLMDLGSEYYVSPTVSFSLVLFFTFQLQYKYINVVVLLGGSSYFGFADGKSTSEDRNEKQDILE